MGGGSRRAAPQGAVQALTCANASLPSWGQLVVSSLLRARRPRCLASMWLPATADRKGRHTQGRHRLRAGRLRRYRAGRYRAATPCARSRRALAQGLVSGRCHRSISAPPGGLARSRHDDTAVHTRRGGGRDRRSWSAESGSRWQGPTPGSERHRRSPPSRPCRPPRQLRERSKCRGRSDFLRPCTADGGQQSQCGPWCERLSPGDSGRDSVGADVDVGQLRTMLGRGRGDVTVPDDRKISSPPSSVSTLSSFTQTVHVQHSSWVSSGTHGTLPKTILHDIVVACRLHDPHFWRT